MTDQDQVNERCCCLIIRGGRISAKALALAMRAFLYGGKRIHKFATTHKGEQTVEQLRQQGKCENIAISDENIGAFERIARKHRIDFALEKDSSEQPPKWLVYFKARDSKDMKAAFDEFSAQQLGKSRQKPSLVQTLQRMMEKVKGQDLERTRHQDRGLER